MNKTSKTNGEKMKLKQLLTIISMAVLFVACSSKENKNEVVIYTSVDQVNSFHLSSGGTYKELKR